MKPCFVTTSFLPIQHNSGISNALYLLIKYLHAKKNIKSTVFAPVQASCKKHEDLEFVSIRRFSRTNVLGYEMSFSLKDILEKENRLDKFDFVHSYHYGFFPAATGYDFAKKHGVPHFFTTAFHPPASTFKRFLMSSYSHIQGGKILSGSSNIFPFNENEMRQLSQYSKGKYKIIPCPVNNEIFYPRRQKFSTQTVTYIGTLLQWKGPQIALEIFNSMHEARKNINFNIIGKGPLETELRRNANRNTRVLSNLSAREVSEILAKSDVVVCPTKYESFGSAIAESLMCGTPVVSTKVGAVPETVGTGGILSEYGDWKGMKNSIERILDDNILRKKLAKRAIIHSNNYKYMKVASAIYKSYKAHN